MKIILILIKILSCVAYANAHGHLIEPPNRLFDPIEPNNEIDWKTGCARVTHFDVNQQLSGDFQHRFTYDSGAGNVCGQNLGEKYGPMDVTLTQSPRKTYLSGTRQQILAHFWAGHPGTFSFYLCKLDNISDVATQDCFEKNPLKLSIIYDLHNVNGRPVLERHNGSLMNEYTVKVEDNLAHRYAIDAQLPPGLTCDNCILRFEWIAWAGFSTERDQPNGELRRNCADIKIIPNPDDKQIYKPNYRPPPPANYPKQFICLGETIPQWIFPLPYNKPDPFLYNGAGAACWSDPKLYAGPGGCDVCARNCLSKDKTCPAHCYCRWYPYGWGTVNDQSLIWVNSSINKDVIKSSICTIEPERTFVNLLLFTTRKTIDECESMCVRTPKCTHFLWINNNNNMECSLKFGNVQMSDAFPYRGDMACGIITSAYKDPIEKKNPGYLGCYRDRANIRDLPLEITGLSVTIENCRSACNLKKYKYAGLQAGGQCWCGNSYGSYGQNRLCNTACLGNQTQICGGWWSNSVYAV